MTDPKTQIIAAEVEHHAHDAAMQQFAATAFAEDGPAELAYHTVASPIGELVAAVTHSGLVAIGFDGDHPESLLTTLSNRISPAIVELPSAIADVREQLDAYFSGSLARFDLPLDRRLYTPFQSHVLAATERIPRGEVRSYGEIAAAAGRPKGAQATGQALGANPIPIVVPCHRVVAADGSLRGYAGGLDRKRYLLDLERGSAPLF